MLSAGEACRDRELNGRGAYVRRVELAAANGEDGIGIDVALCDGDIGARDGELPRGRL
jgi:hypothetical protein